MARSTLIGFRSASWTDLLPFLSSESAFHIQTGNFRGVKNDPDCPTLPGYGRMDHADRNHMRMIHDVHGITYIVFSYATPIAYRDRRGIWTTPGAGYSQSTKRHLGLLLPAVGRIMDGVNA